MGKLWKNNLFKLPVFLLAVAGLCGGLLSAVNYFTEAKIVQNEIDSRNKIYTSTFADLYSSDTTFTVDVAELSETLSTVGITEKAIVKTSETEVAGYVYAGTVKGFVDNISFVVSFANGKYHHFQCISNKESKGNILSTLDGLIHNYSVSGDNFFETSTYTNAVSGASRTDDKLIPALNACAADYAANL